MAEEEEEEEDEVVGMVACYSTGLSSSITLSMTVFRMCEDIRVSVLLRRNKQKQDVGESLLKINTVIKIHLESILNFCLK